MRKICPRCGSEFECCTDGDVAHCHCVKVQLSEQQRAAIKVQHDDCLCYDCLLYFVER